MKPSNPLAVVFLMAITAAPVAAQDLFERHQNSSAPHSAVTVTEYRGRDRLDLRATGGLPRLTDDSGSARLGVSATLESDFACGRFDVKATLKNLLGKEARDDFLKGLIGALESQLTYNALVLACEASPTACQAFQHFRVNANAMLGIQYDRCQAVEQAIGDSMQGIKAKAIKDCVEEKRRNGKSMGEALEACEKAQTLRDLEGHEVKEIDVLEELRKTFKLGEVKFQNLQTLLSPLKLTPSGARGEVQADGVLRRFDALNTQYQDAWTAVTDRAASDPKTPPREEDLKRLSPPNQPGVLPAEVTDIAKLPAPQRRVFIRSIAGQSALAQLVTEVQDVERMLAAMRKNPQLDADRVKQVEREAEDLRLQIRHIDERVRRQEDYSRELLRASGYAAEFQGRTAAQAIAASSDGVRDDKLLREVAPKYGTLRGCPTSDCGSKGGSTPAREGR